MFTPKLHVTVASLLIAALCAVMLAASPPVLYAAHNQNHNPGGSGKGNQDQDKEDKDEDQDQDKKDEDQDKDKKDKQDKGNQGQDNKGPPGGESDGGAKSSDEKGTSDEQPTGPPPAAPEIRVLEPRAEDETREEGSRRKGDSVIQEGTIQALAVGPASVTVQVSPAGDARRTYVRLGRRIIDMVELGAGLGATYTTVLPAVSEPRGLTFTVTADFGSTTASVKGLLLPQPAGASTTRVPEPELLLTAVNAVFRAAHDRNPTGTDWSYWANRILRGEKTSVPDLFGAMQWQQRFGRR